jgi:hypothetical protein
MEPYMEKIILWHTDPEYDFNGTRIFRELKKHGYTGTINPIYRVLQKLDEGFHGEISKKATIRVETPPMIFLFYHRKPKINTYFTNFISQSHLD